jgi:thiol peroxidase
MSRNNEVTMGGNPVNLYGDAIKVGAKAPDFTVFDAELKPVTLADAAGKTVIISVVPSVDTGVCAAQTRRFNEEASKLNDVVIYTISVDLPFALGRFCSAEGIDKVQTLSDYKDREFGKKYGFFIEDVALLARGIVIVDPEGVVKYVEYVPEVTTHPDYDKALAQV